MNWNDSGYLRRWIPSALAVMLFVAFNPANADSPLRVASVQMEVSNEIEKNL